MNNWQPIETCNRYAVPFLAWHPVLGVLVARVGPLGWDACTKEGDLIQPNENGPFEEYGPPTHWQHLPDSPDKEAWIFEYVCHITKRTDMDMKTAKYCAAESYDIDPDADPIDSADEEIGYMAQDA